MHIQPKQGQKSPNGKKINPSNGHSRSPRSGLDQLVSLSLVLFFEYKAKNIEWNRMELRKIWHDGRFSAKASDSSSGTQQLSF